MSKAQIATEFTVSAENRTGELAKIFAALAEKKVNLRAYTAYVDGTKGFVKFVPDNSDASKQALDENGYSYDSKDVLVVEIADGVGAGAQVASKIAQAGLGISHSHASSTGGSVLLVFNTADNQKALEVVG